MRRHAFAFLALIFALGMAAAPAMAHHSFSAEFDATKQVTLKGYVTKIEWTNPHVWFYLNVKDETGKVTNWGFEMGPPHGLQGRGWTRETMKLGDEVLVNGSRAKNGSNRVNARTVTMTKTGVVLGAASSENTTTP
jgi:hypothetical protein